MIISWPKGLRNQTPLNHYPAHLIDILPTIAELAGANYPLELNGKSVLPAEGESLLPAIRGDKSIREKPLFWEWAVGRAVRKGNWKLVKHGKDADWELYDLEKDPSEIQNVSLKFPEKAQELKALFEEWKKKVRS